MQYVDIVARSTLFLVFVLSTMSKIRSRKAWRNFCSSVDQLVHVSTRRQPWLPTLVVGSEVAVTTLVASPSPAAVLVGFGLAAVLLAAFTLAIGRALGQGMRVACHCFGGASPVGPAHLFRNLLLIAVAGAGAAGVVAADGASTDADHTVLALLVGSTLGVLLVTVDEIVYVARPEGR